ncbi:MAG: DUF1919 domain-containing protein [Eubacterium sp.]|nr:DUF1919 domain-containing protein [Eubacterium sp.]
MKVTIEGDMMVKEKCVIWGMGNDYEGIINQINFEIYKGNIEVVAVVCSQEDKYCSYRDGFPIVLKEELMELDFEYVVVASSIFYKEIKAEAIKLGISLNRIINGQVFKLPLFDFRLYSSLIKNPVTIITDDCWGGYVYHYLGLEFSSPLINMLWDKKEYIEFITDPLFYLQTELTMVREGDLKSGFYPVGKLGKNGKYVEIKFIHNADFNEAKQQWDRRKKRINKDNLFVKMGCSISDLDIKYQLSVFDDCKYNKILFYNGDEDIMGKCNTNRFIWQAKKAGRVNSFFYPNYMRGNYMYVIDILKLLTGEKNYSRE